ncbi:MAG: outer membrane protein assembly factor BamB family protein [Planctomycetota bacterium]|jgi:outer membrane protein assembly factor BamB
MKSRVTVKGGVSALIFGICLSVIGTGLYGTARAADWPNYRGPDYNGITNETDWKSNWGDSGPKVLWKKSVGIGFSSVTVADGRAYAMGNTGKRGNTDIVFCFDAVTGEEKWTHSYPCPLGEKYYEGGTLSTPTADGNNVYTLSKMGSLFCLNAADGEVIWQKELNKRMSNELPTWHFSSSALVAGDMLVLNIGDAGLALDKNTGAEIWSNGKGQCGYATPVPFVMGGQRGLAILGKDSIIAVSPDNGRKLWQFPWATKDGINAADPIINGNYVFISSAYNKGCALLEINAGKAAKVWESKVMRSQMNCCVLYEGFLYGFDEKESLKCIAPQDGTEKWRDGSLGKGALMMSADGRMIMMSDKGELAIAQANPQEFKVLARAQVLPKGRCWTTPTLANGKIYARNTAGDLVCVDVAG